MAPSISSVSCSIFKIGGMSGSNDCGQHPVNEVFTRYNQNMSGSGYKFTLDYSASISGATGSWTALESNVIANGTNTQFFHNLGCLFDTVSGSSYAFCYRASTYNSSATSSIVFGNIITRDLASCICHV